MSVNEKMTAIADAIRDKTGGTEALTLDDMAKGVNEVYEKGISEEDVKIWKMITLEGTRTDFSHSFRKENFSDYSFINPVQPRVAEYMFYQYAGAKLPGNLDFSSLSVSNENCLHRTFGWVTKLSVIPDIGIPAPSVYKETFYGAAPVITIDILRVNEDCKFTNTFYNATQLRNIKFEGVIGQSISFSNSSSLTVESMINIIRHLKDYSGTENAGRYILTLYDSRKNLMAAQGAIFGGKTYDEYITDIGWNLA